jgi:FKBP-type peptidyl-prolyl cis-trans isomerase SlpA
VNRVEPGSFLTLHYRLRSSDGDAFVDTFATAPATLSLGTGELAPAMEARLIGLAAGSEESFALAPGEAFGHGEGDGDGDYQVGDVVRFPGPEGQTIAAVLRTIDGDSLVFDFNHPLAGRPLTFDVKLIAVL